jgi:hypothetical protein
MAGIIVEYARFVEAQQRRARIGPQRVRWPRETSPETTGSAAVDKHRFDIGESRQFVSMQDEAAHHRGSTTRGSVDG